MKRLTLLLTILVISLMSVAVAAAQDPADPTEQTVPTFNRPDGTLVDIVAEATGLDRAEIVSELTNGATLAEIIAANDGDLATVQAAMVEALVTERNLDEATAQARVEQFLNGELRPGNGDFGGRDDGLLDTVAEAIGLDRQEIAQQLRDGATLADIITASGADVDEVQALVVEALVANRNLDESEAQARVEQFFSGEFQFGGGQGFRDNSILDTVAEVTGLDRQEIAQQLRDGATLADIITASGGDLEAIQAQLVDVLVTNRALDEATAQERITQALNGEFQLGQGGPRGQQGGFGPGNGQGGPRGNGQQGGPNGQQQAPANDQSQNG